MQVMSMMDECDSREDLSEDDHPSTDASEDSVEVMVKPISRPPPHSSSPSRYPRWPHKFRKAYLHHRSTGSSVPSAPFGHDLRKSPEVSCSPLSTTGRASPQTPLCPRARVKRRKTSEPKRLCTEDISNKRPAEDASDRPAKISRSGSQDSSHAVSDGTPSPPHFLGHHPLFGPFVPTPGLSPFLLPPGWSAVAHYPYNGLIGAVVPPHLGILPGAIAPPAYPIFSILPTPPSMALLPPVAPKSPRVEAEDGKVEQNPLPLVVKEEPRHGALSTSHLEVGAHSSKKHLQEGPVASPNLPSHTEVSVVRQVGKVSPSFLSVDSLIASETKSELSTVPKTEPPDEVMDHRPLVSSHDILEDGEHSIQALLHQPKQKQRNYKNMTRERRIEANARERTRVHTISAAFEKLRQCVPSYSHNQKLSKLSVLRIACSYILSLSRLAGYDYSEGETNPSLSECVDLTTRTIQVEGKAKKKREE